MYDLRVASMAPTRHPVVHTPTVTTATTTDPTPGFDPTPRRSSPSLSPSLSPLKPSMMSLWRQRRFHGDGVSVPSVASLIKAGKIKQQPKIIELNDELIKIIIK